MEFFKHQNQSYPAALSDRGSLYTGTKSDLIDYLLTGAELPANLPVIDGSAFIHANKPTNVKTFDQYSRDLMKTLEKEIAKHNLK